MATFKIIVGKGNPSSNILYPSGQQIDSCGSVHSFVVQTVVGNSVTLTLTLNGGTGLYYMSVNNIVVASPHTFTSTGTDTVKVYMKNSAILDTLDLTLEAEDTTNAITETENITRESTGTIC